MCPYKCLIFLIISVIYTCVEAQFNDLASNQLYSQPLRVATPKLDNLYLMQNKLQQRNQQFLQPFLQQLQQQEKVKIQLFYECLCPDCRVFDTQQFAPTVKKLGNHLDVHIYPYGNARTIIHAGGKIEVICQHGPAECYGNMLHACAIDFLGNITLAVEFNTCMMSFDQNNKGSDNEAADKCGRLMNIDSGPIKHCAISRRGLMLLKNYGDESKKVGFSSVPFILMNGNQYSGDNFLRDVCDIFRNPPSECNE
ncbi:unnamed protein product [Arctia plantaginis]|uniref:Uncharacterized protein n=1 Tax=Arctia plantaginis TaxID=874455 RepID=A0A8S1A2B7_ARCPL|nr:unnamed protein product [Arctia plantaginis]CAB3240552.1 unnamed protein product [Arctia plantaginis]